MATYAQRFTAHCEAIFGTPLTNTQQTKYSDSVAYARGYATQFALLTSAEKAQWVIETLKREAKTAHNNMVGNIAAEAAKGPADAELP